MERGKHKSQECMWLRIQEFRDSSHYAAQAYRPSPKLLSRGEGRSPFKYIMSVLLSHFEYFIEKMFNLSVRVWVSILGVPKLLPRGQTLDAKSTKKCCHVGTLEAFHLRILATSVKVKRPDSHSPPIKLQDWVFKGFKPIVT